GRVTEQLNPAGLSYTYQYEKDRITITDSLNRREVLHTQGEGGLKRVVKKEHADGSVTQSQFDAVGRLRAQTDAAGRTSPAPTAVTGQKRPRRWGASAPAGKCLRISAYSCAITH
ncbi:hypothetical protein, partial [Escherichia coli]|uniref:hypothetical protein n=1 Tax=Escherichia coli TaxID=562 RepID=UPI001C6FF1D9